MFDLENSIRVWRKQMLAAGIQTPATLDELELHLREEIEQQVKSGLDEQKAFEATAQQIGQATVLKTEFSKVGETFYERLKQLVCALAGISNYQLATNMNTPNQNIEPRWTTYAKVGTFIFPAIFLWLITVVYVLPKAAEICQAAGTTIFNFAQPVPVIIRVWAGIGQAMIFLTNHVFLIGGAIVLTFVLLERYFSQWPRYRRAAIGAGAFILNAAVLLSLIIMIVSILVAAPALTHHLK
jgi:hypothetical protein